MVTAGKPVDDLLFGKGRASFQKLKKGDIVIDGGNSFFEDSMRRGKLLAKKAESNFWMRASRAARRARGTARA